MKHVAMIILLVLIWGLWATLQQAYEPVISTDIALGQMKDTTEGHAAVRAYTAWGQKFLYSPFIPMVLSWCLFLVFYLRTIKKSLKKGEEK